MDNNNSKKEENAVKLKVYSEGGEPPAPSNKPQFPPGQNPELVPDLNEGISQEDKELKERLELAVERLSDPSPEIQKNALDIMAKDIREATSSMTAVPKPLKFLIPHWSTIKAAYTALPASHPNKKSFADMMSVLSMTMAEEGSRDVLNYKLAGHPEEIGEWGHEYVRSLAGEVGVEYNSRFENDPTADVSDLIKLTNLIVPFNLAHNAEPEAVDLLLELDRLPQLLEFGVDEHSYARVCLYLLKCSDYLSDKTEVKAALSTAFHIYLTHRQYTDALRVALRFTNEDQDEHVRQVFSACNDINVKKQLSYLLASVNSTFTLDNEELDNIIGNNQLHGHYLELAKDIDVLEAKSPDDIFKTHLSDTRSGLDSAIHNQASTIVNGFVNAGFGTDKLITPSPEDCMKWLGRNKEGSKTSVAASLGLLHLWNPSEVSSLDSLLYSDSPVVRAGALMGIGLCSSGTRNPDADVAFALLSEHLGPDSTSERELRLGAVLGVATAYTAQKREDVVEPLLAVLEKAGAGVKDQSTLSASLEFIAYNSLAVGMVFSASGDKEKASVILKALNQLNTVDSQQPIIVAAVLGIALLFLTQGRSGMQFLKENGFDIGDDEDEEDEDENDEEKDEEMTPAGKEKGKEIHSQAQEVWRSMLLQTMRAFSYCGTGDVIQFQKLLRVCAEHPESNDLEEAHRQEEEKAENEANLAAQAEVSGGNLNDARIDASSLDPLGLGTSSGAQGIVGSGIGSPTTSSSNAHDGNALLAIRPRYLFQTLAVVGLGCIAYADETSAQMATRISEQLLAYGDPSVKHGVPLLLAMLYPSDPAYTVVDTLSRLTHDPDRATAINAIVSLGIVAAGTNNSRVAQMLRTLAVFHASNSELLYATRIAQGLLHAGKGLLSLKPLRSDRTVPSIVGMTALLTFLCLSTQFKSTFFLNSRAHLAFLLAPALHPRCLITVDEEGAVVKTDVRVGAAVETVGQAGRPKTISGFQTMTSPVLLSAHDRAELASDEYLPLSNTLEGVVVVKKNPNFKKKEEELEKKFKVVPANKTRSDLTWG